MKRRKKTLYTCFCDFEENGKPWETMMSNADIGKFGWPHCPQCQSPMSASPTKEIENGENPV